MKDDKSRIVPILKPLAPVLAEWRLFTGGHGLLFRPRVETRGGRPGSPPAFVREHTQGMQLRKALETLGLPRMTWYSATRHTFASQRVLAGGAIAQLALILGQANTTTSERCAHLRPGTFSDGDLAMVDVDLSSGEAAVLQLQPRPDTGDLGHGLGTPVADAKIESSKSSESQHGPVAQVDRAAVS